MIVGLVIGIFVGAGIGVVLSALMNVSKKCDMEEMKNEDKMMEDNKKIIEQLTSLEEQTADIAVSLRTIGNLLTQINEKCYKKPYVK